MQNQDMQLRSGLVRGQRPEQPEVALAAAPAEQPEAALAAPVEATPAGLFADPLTLAGPLVDPSFEAALAAMLAEQPLAALVGAEQAQPAPVGAQPAPVAAEPAPVEPAPVEPAPAEPAAVAAQPPDANLLAAQAVEAARAAETVPTPERTAARQFLWSVCTAVPACRLHGGASSDIVVCSSCGVLCPCSAGFDDHWHYRDPAHNARWVKLHGQR